MHGEGGLVMHLTTMGYKLSYEQVLSFLTFLSYYAEPSVSLCPRLLYASFGNYAI
jgi:hypothetical protein